MSSPPPPPPPVCYSTAPHLKDLLLTTSLEKVAQSASSTDDAVHPPPRVAIVGGSMGGCCTAIALSSIGCTTISIFERTPGELPSQGAGLVIQPDMAAFLTEFKICKDVAEISFQSSGRQYVNREGVVIGGDDIPQYFSAWDVLHRALRCAVPQSCCYYSGTTVKTITLNTDTDNDNTSSILLHFDNTSANDSSSRDQSSSSRQQQEQQQLHSPLSADLLVGADGPGSIVRSSVLSADEQRSEYQGYLGWRGVVPERDTPPHILAFLKEKFTVFQGPNFHILCYLIPGDHGEILQGERRVNWVWYWNCEESSEHLKEILTDKNGRFHGYSVPRGLLNAKITQQRKALAKEVLPEVLADMVCATEDIFVQAIHDYLSPKLGFAELGVALVGDAGCVLRPHTAAGTTKAAVNAWALARCLVEDRFCVKAALRRYDVAMGAVARQLVDVGVKIGTQSQFPSCV